MRCTPYGTGHGPVEILMPDGEVLTGEYALVRGGAIGCGSIDRSVYGPGGTTTGTATATSYAVPGGSPGMVSAFGDRGTAMECEVYNDNFSGHRYGACRSSKGALYRLWFWDTCP